MWNAAALVGARLQSPIALKVSPNRLGKLLSDIA
jgi:hypothetical protein